MKWSDGEPMTAKDAAYTFNRIINGTFEKTNYGNYVSNITKAEAPDDTTLILRVDKPTPIMETLAVYILPEHVSGRSTRRPSRVTTTSRWAANPSSGRGRIWSPSARSASSPVRGQSELLPRQARRRRGRLQALRNPDALAQALKKGEIDFADSLAANVFKSLADAPNIERTVRRSTRDSTSSRSTPGRR